MWTAPIAPTRWRRPPGRPSVQSATVNFMALKMIVEFAEGQDPKAVMEQVRRNCKKVEDDCEIYL